MYDLHDAAHRELVEQAYGPWEEAQQREFFAPLVGDHDVFVLEQGSARVGAVYLGHIDGDTWLELVEIDPAAQGQGLGTHLLAWVADRSAAAGRGTVLQVHKVNNRARDLYLRSGFVSAGETATHHLLRQSAAT